MKVISKIKNKYNDLRPVVKGSIWFTFATLFQSLLNILITPLFSRVMTLNEAGEYSLFITWYNIILIFCTLNISGGAFYTILHNQDDEDCRKKVLMNSVYINLFLTFAVFFVVYLLYFLNINFMNMPISYINLMLMSILIDIPIKIYIAYSKYENKYRLCSLSIIIQSVISTALMVLFVYLFQNKVVGRILGKEIGLFVAFIIAIVTFLSYKKTKIDFKLIKNIFIVTAPLLLHYLAQDVLSQSDRVFLERINGKEEVAIYSLAYNFINIIIVFIVAFNSSFTPWLYRKIENKDKKSIVRITSIYFSFIVFLTTLVGLLSKEIVFILGGEKYGDSVKLIPVLLVTVYFILFYDVISVVEFYYSKTLIASLITVLACLVNICLNFLLIPSLSSFGAAIATGISYFIMCVLHFIAYFYYSSKNNIKDIFNYKILVLILLIGILLLFGSYFLIDFDIIRYVLFGLLLITAFVLFFIFRKKLFKILFSK